MNAFEIDATDEARMFVGRIATAMVALFTIPHDEAVGRINQFWRGASMLTDAERTALLHQDPDHWAKTIYYGVKTWWLDESALGAALYPAQPPGTTC